MYTPALLAVYDTLVLGLNSRSLWRCPKSRGVEFYNRHVGARHLDIGVGSGYFLDRCRFSVQDPQITLLDLSTLCLAHVARRLARYSPETRHANVLDERNQMRAVLLTVERYAELQRLAESAT